MTNSDLDNLLGCVSDASLIAAQGGEDEIAPSAPVTPAKGRIAREFCRECLSTGRLAFGRCKACVCFRCDDSGRERSGKICACQRR